MSAETYAANNIIHSDEPFNAEPPAPQLAESFITPVELFFVRDHGTAPTIDADSYQLLVDGLVQTPLSLSLDQLRQQFPRVTVAATLQCAGNRRQELIEIDDIPGETPWQAGAISTATWSGVPLREVLLAAGVSTEAGYIASVGHDSAEQSDGGGVGSSISLEKAMHPEVLLAYEMNGQPLPTKHGYPLRLVVPGFIGVRSIKWLAGISAQREPSTNYFHTHAYKQFSPDVGKDAADWSSAPVIDDFALTSAICAPEPGATLQAGLVAVRGYALAGQGRMVERVELSIDNGATWHEAAVERGETPWTWCLWRAELALPTGEHVLLARAWDDAGETQPRDLAAVWNFKGYMNNAWHRVPVRALPA